MGLYIFFVKNYMEYGFEELLDFIDIYFMLLNYWILMESN